MTIKLYNYWRSSASWRVRVALALKDIDYEYIAVNLIKDGGEQKASPHAARNPMQQVPALEIELDGKTRMVAQSMAILELLEELYPEPALLPADRYLRCRARELAELVNAGIQPHQNLTPMGRIEALQSGAGKAHAKHFNDVGLAAYEARVAETAGRFSIGDTPTIADLCLVPQVASARRFGVEDMHTRFPLVTRIDAACVALPAFAGAAPEAQPDHVAS